MTNSTFTYPAPNMEEILAEVQDAKDIPEMVKSFSDLNLSTDRYGGPLSPAPASSNLNMPTSRGSIAAT